MYVLKIQNIWFSIVYLQKISGKKVAVILEVNMAWKHLVLGFTYTGNQSSVVLNNVISFNACTIFKYKMKCKLIKENVTNEGLILFLRSSPASLFLVNKLPPNVKLIIVYLERFWNVVNCKIYEIKNVHCKQCQNKMS